YVDNQVRYNKDKIDSLEGGLGALVDADLAKESAKLQALQIRQQLGTQALSISNQSPQMLLSLFR
ncbi:MAG: flagellin, partial [Roseomonas sp.]|nr:flagellin [Roseomonas sp.]